MSNGNALLAGLIKSANDLGIAIWTQASVEGLLSEDD